MISIEPLVQAVVAHLAAANTAAARVDVFDGVVQATMDSDGRAHPYVAVYPTPGQADRMPLAPRSDALLWSFQTTCAGGDPTRAIRAIDRVRDRLDGHRLVVDNVLVGVIREPEFYSAGPLREDVSIKPTRWWAPLQWELYAVDNSSAA